MFKQKNKKIIQCDSRITLDAKHNEIIKNFKEEQKNLKKYYLELKSEEEKLEKIQMNNSIALNPEDLTFIFEIQNNIDELKEKIKNIELQSKETDYFIKTGNIFLNNYRFIFRYIFGKIFFKMSFLSTRFINFFKFSKIFRFLSINWFCYYRFPFIMFYF